MTLCQSIKNGWSIYSDLGWSVCSETEWSVYPLFPIKRYNIAFVGDPEFTILDFLK